MPNLYATPAELKAALPDGFRSTTTKYDPLLNRLAGGVSRWIDRECKRVFYPSLATRYYNGDGSPELWIDDLLSITSISYSFDYGATYTALTTADYIATVGGDYNRPESTTKLILNRNSTALSTWPRSQRGVRIVGTWGYSDDAVNAFEDTGDTVEDNPLTAAATLLTVNDIDALDPYGAYSRIQAGHLLRIESEYIETALTVNVAANTVGLVRGRNGTAAAAHAQNTVIYVWRIPEPVKDAAVIQAVRQMERGFQGFGDARAQPEISQIFFFKQIDPEAASKLSTYRRVEFP